MDIDELRKRRAIKVVIVDIIMATSVVVIVGILVAVVAGWRINKDFTVEQNGLVSIQSIPVNASVTIDGELQHQTTNMSRMLREGKHKVVLEKEGYDTWEKEFEITPGWLVRLEYARLFKKDRESETLKAFSDLKFFYASPDRTTAIYAPNNSTFWTVMTDFNSAPKTYDIDIGGVFSNTANGDFPYNINSIEWGKNNERILINISGDQINEWGIIDLKNSKDSLNLSTYQFSDNSRGLSNFKFDGDTNDRVLALMGNDLVRINLDSKTISDFKIKNVSKFFVSGPNLIYLTKDKDNKSVIELIRIGDQKATKVTDIPVNAPKISFALTRFNSMSYIIYMIGNKLYAYKGNSLPSSEEDISSMQLIAEATTSITPENVIVSRNNEFVIFREGTRVLVYDTELEKWHEYDCGDKNIRFLDDVIFYRLNVNGEILAWDFDNTNYRSLISSGGTNYDVIISENNRYLYYIKSDLSLIREKL